MIFKKTESAKVAFISREKLYTEKQIPLKQDRLISVDGLPMPTKTS